MKKELILCLLALTTSSAIAADNSGLYVYGSAGQSSTDRQSEVDQTLINSGFTGLSSSGDDSDTGYKLQVGWRFNQYFAVEGGYINLGEYSYNATTTTPAVTRYGEIEVDGFNIGVEGSIPLNDQFSLFAKAGGFAYELDYYCSGTGVACPNPDRDDSDFTPYYGLGAAWNFTDQWFVRAEYEVFTDIGESFNNIGSTGTSKDDTELLSVGIGYRF